jgi:hypothetical protein
MPLSNDSTVNELAGKLNSILRGAFGTPEAYRGGKYIALKSPEQDI